MNKHIFSTKWAQLAHFSMEHSHEMIFWVRSDSSFYYVNPAVCKALGYTPLELSNLKAADILTDYDDGETHVLREKIEQRGQYLIRASLTRKDGTTFPVESLNNSIHIDGDVINCAFARDISDQVSIEKALLRNQKKLQLENELLRSTYELSDSLNIIGTSKALVDTLELGKGYAQNDITILIRGESGVGKEDMAKFIHFNSKRRKLPMISVNCATLTTNDVISHLFGHVKGAFTGAYQDRVGLFELANDSTLFLDEVGELSLEVQAMLLRVIQTKTFTRMGDKKVMRTNTRIIAATNRNLEDMVAQKTFRDDLFFRLNVLTLTIPPLRNRLSDLEQLINFKLKTLNQKYGLKREVAAKENFNELRAYPFPGNIRELFNLIERAYFSDFSGPLRITVPQENQAMTSQLREANIVSLEENERRHIILALSQCNGQVGGKDGAAALLGVNRNTLNSKIKALGITITI